MVPVYWHYGGRGSWCHEIVNWLTRGCDHRMGIDGADRAIVVVKADQTPSVHQLKAELAQIDRGVLIVTANEEGTFNTAPLTHPRLKIWLQTPARKQYAHDSLPWGWTPDCVLDGKDGRVFDWSFAGQNTHQRRNDCISVLRGMHGGFIEETNGFSQGLSRAAYRELLCSTRVVPCPSGPITVDSFRVCEALECGAIPIVDGVSPTGEYPDYWKRVFGPAFPLPIVRDWTDLPKIMEQCLEHWEDNARLVQTWWTLVKQEWIQKLVEDLNS